MRTKPDEVSERGEQVSVKLTVTTTTKTTIKINVVNRHPPPSPCGHYIVTDSRHIGQMQVNKTNRSNSQ